jgi:hypothetical protein
VIINRIKNVVSSLKLFDSLTKGSFGVLLKAENGKFPVAFCSCGTSRQQLSIAQPIRLSCYHIGDAILLKMQKLPDVSKRYGARMAFCGAVRCRAVSYGAVRAVL